ENPLKVVVWDVASGEELFAHEERFNRGLAISPNGKLLATFQHKEAATHEVLNLNKARPGLLKIWDLAHPENKPIVIECENTTNGLQFSSDGSRLAGLSRRADGGDGLALPGV